MTEGSDDKARRFNEATKTLSEVMEALASEYGSDIAIAANLHLLSAVAIRAGADRHAFLGALGAAYDTQVSAREA